MNLIAVARRAFLPSVEDDLLTGTIVFDVAIAILPMKIFLHRRFHALNAAMFEIRESDDVTKHGAIRIDARGVMFEINPTQISGAKFFAQRAGQRLWQLALDYYVAAFTLQFFSELPLRNA